MGDPIITFTFKPYPAIPSSEYCHHIVQELGKMSQACIAGVFKSHAPTDIFVTYAGYLRVSDTVGEIAFPYKQTKPIINILVTSKIIPIMMAGNTVHHWEIDSNTPAAMYRFELKKDTLTQLSYWDAQVEPLSNHKVTRVETFGITTEIIVIPIETMIILAKPKHIYVPIGSTPTQESANIVLPDIYVKKGLSNVSQALYAVNIKHLFGPVRYLNKAEPMRDISLINP